jgi:hypothetical protein
MPEIIQRTMVDLALNTAEQGLKDAFKELKGGVNKDWAVLTEARKTAVETRDDTIDAQESDRKKSRNAAIAAYKGAQGKPNAPSYDSHVQELNSIEDRVNGRIEEARKLCKDDGAAAENNFRTGDRDNFSTFKKKVTLMLDALEAALP